MSDQQETARLIAVLENSFCNPRKLKEAAELRADLAAEGLSEAEINDLVNEWD